MKIHYLESTEYSYDQIMCGKNFLTDEDINRGDVVVIKSAEIVAVADTWPIAVTKAFGEFHTIKEGSTIENVTNEAKIINGFECAVELADKLRFDV